MVLLLVLFYRRFQCREKELECCRVKDGALEFERKVYSLGISDSLVQYLIARVCFKQQQVIVAASVISLKWISSSFFGFF
jgi:hypothetical protein